MDKIKSASFITDTFYSKQLTLSDFFDVLDSCSKWNTLNFTFLLELVLLLVYNILIELMFCQDYNMFISFYLGKTELPVKVLLNFNAKIKPNYVGL